MSQDHIRPVWGFAIYIYITGFFSLTFGSLTFGCEQCFATINDANEWH